MISSASVIDRYLTEGMNLRQRHRISNMVLVGVDQSIDEP